MKLTKRGVYIKRLIGLSLGVATCFSVLSVTPDAFSADNAFDSAAQVFKLSDGASANNAKIFWQPVQGANSYTVNRIYEGQKYLVGSTSGTSIDDYDLPVGVSASYSVTAYNGKTYIGDSSSNTVTTFTPENISTKRDNVNPPQITNDPLINVTAPSYDSQIKAENPKPLNNGGFKFVRGSECPSAEQLAQYWTIRSPRDIDQRRSWIQMKSNGSTVYLNQSITWDFTAQIDASPKPTYFQCHTEGAIADAQTGKQWKLDDSRLEGTAEYKNPTNGHATFIAHLEGVTGYTRAELLIVDVDPDTGVVSTYADRPFGLDIRDMSAYIENNDMYIVGATNDNKDVSLIKLNDNWSAPSSLVATLLRGQHREAVKLYKIGNYYYLYSSATMGSYPSQTKYMYSTNLASGWSSLTDVGNATSSDGQFYSIVKSEGSARTTYSEMVTHYGANRKVKTSLGNVARIHPLAINGTYHATAFYPEVDIDDVYGAVPVQYGRNISYGRTIADSENGNTNLLTDGSDFDTAPAVNHSQKPYTVTVDLGAISDIREVDFSSRVIIDPITYNVYKISVSNDGKSFTDVTDGTSSHFSGFVPNSYDKAISARYVRLTMLDWPIAQGSGSIYNPAKEGLFEFSVYGNLPEDKTAPVFSGVDPVSVEYGSKFDALAGVSAKDDRDGDVTKSIKVEGSVDTSKPGEQKLVYTVSDKAGNVARAERVVTVKAQPVAPDKTAPVFSGVDPVSVEYGSKFDALAGVSAKDDRDGDVTKSIKVEGSVDTSKPGEQKLVYTVSDKAGNVARAERVVTVKAPVALSAAPTRASVALIEGQQLDLSGIKANVTYSDGSVVKDVDIDWPAVDVSKPGDVKVQGTVRGITDKDGKALSVTVTVKVAARVITSVTPTADPITVPTAKDSDSAPAATGKVVVKWNDGTEETRDVNLTLPQGWNQQIAEHQVTATGRTDGWEKDIPFTVTVEAATVERIDNPADFTTQVKRVPDLSNIKAKVTWSNGRVTNEKVTWQKPDDTVFDQVTPENEPIVVNGTVLDGQYVNVRITVVEATVESVDNLEGVELKAGEDPDEVLPHAVNAHWSNGTTSPVAVTWKSDGLDFSNRSGKDKTVQVTGTVTDWNGTVTVNVTVHSAVATKAVIVGDSEFTVDSGTAPDLKGQAGKAKVTWNDGGADSVESIVWGSFEGYKERRGGDFTVYGAVKGLSVDAQVHVNAATPVKLVKDHVDVTTEVGKVPTLPKTLQVVWSNGDVTDEAVKWDSYDAKKLDKATKFDVSGTVTVPADASEQATETKEFDAKVSITVANKATEKKPGLKLPGTGAGIALIAVVTIAIIAVAMTVLIISKRKLD